jgi:hypothetical protein
MPLYSATNPLPVNMERRRLFNPSRIAGLDLWLDAADGDTLFDETSGGNFVTTNGGSVKRWEDKSGGGRHASCAGHTAIFPTLTTAGKNGKNVINFATSKYLTSSFTGVDYNAQTSFIVFQFLSAASTNARGITQASNLQSNDFNGDHYIQVVRNSSNNQFSSYAGSGFRSSVSATLGEYYIARARHTGSSLTFKLNLSEGSSFAHTLNFNFSIFRIGSFIPANALPVSSFINSPVAEVIIYRKALTDAESDLVTNYLNSKWAVY